MRHDWHYDDSISSETFTEVQQDFMKLVPFFANEGITLCGGWFDEDIKISGTMFTFNGDLRYKSPTTFVIGKQGRMGTFDGMTGIDTQGLPYDKAVQCFLLVLKKHVGHAVHVETSESDAGWRKAISLCSNLLGHDYELMDITGNGKLRYKTWELEAYGK